MSTGRSTLIHLTPFCALQRLAGLTKLRARRGTGQHAFPFRWGVQREKSLLKVTISN